MVLDQDAQHPAVKTKCCQARHGGIPVTTAQSVGLCALGQPGLHSESSPSDKTKQKVGSLDAEALDGTVAFTVSPGVHSPGPLGLGFLTISGNIKE